jgi:DNA (cytosine-5)-methyltransferase 1
MDKINMLGLFSGGGGLDLGFSAAGFNSIFSSDIDSFSCKTLTLNQNKQTYLTKHPVLCEDINNLSLKAIRKHIGSKDVDFIIGGPPCQAFSVFGKRKGLDDPRGNLVYEYARIIKEIEPEGFLFENVAGLKTIHDGTLYSELFNTLSIDGKYAISSHEYEVAEFGIPQFRRRVFFIGTKTNKSIPQMVPTHTPQNSVFNAHKPCNTVSSILVGLPPPITDWKGDAFINGHVGRKHSQRIIDRYKLLAFGERDHKTRINKLNPDRPSFTIIVGSDAGGGKGHVHPFEPREVTPRESARIQTFPDWWEFHGTGRHIIRQVGNAVPPLFAAVLAQHVANEVFGMHKAPNLDELIRKLQLSYLQ